MAKIVRIVERCKKMAKKLRKIYVTTTWNLKASGCALLANVRQHESQQRIPTSELYTKKGARWHPY